MGNSRAGRQAVSCLPESWHQRGDRPLAGRATRLLCPAQAVGARCVRHDMPAGCRRCHGAAHAHPVQSCLPAAPRRPRQEREPIIHNAIRFGAVLENVTFDEASRPARQRCPEPLPGSAWLCASVWSGARGVGREQSAVVSLQSGTMALKSFVLTCLLPSPCAGEPRG